MNEPWRNAAGVGNVAGQDMKQRTGTHRLNCTKQQEEMGNRWRRIWAPSDTGADSQTVPAKANGRGEQEKSAILKNKERKTRKRDKTVTLGAEL